MQKEALDNDEGLFYWRKNAKYYMSYKWMSFDAKGCGTGQCSSTVMLGGVCIRKNQLGNIAFGFIVRMIPPYQALGNAKLLEDPILKGYKIGPTYDAEHPHAENFGSFTGKNRADNLAAFSLGYHMGEVPGFEPWLFGRRDIAKLFLQKVMSTDDTYGKYGEYFGKGASIGLDEFTFSPQDKGFNTQSCKPCMSDGSPAKYGGKQSSKQFFETLEKLYKEKSKTQDLPGLDRWLKDEYEDYSK